MEVPGAVILIQQGRIVFSNEFADRTVGYTGEEMLNRNFLDFVHPDAVNSVRRIHQRRIAGKPAPKQYETCISTKTGEKLPCEVRVRKVRYHGRRAFLLHLIDLSERKALERQRLRTEKKQALGRMADGIKVQLADYLRSLEGPATGAAGNDDPPLQKAAAVRNSKILQQLQILTQRQGPLVAAEHFDLKKVLQEAIALCRRQWENTSAGGNGGINFRTYLRSLPPLEGRPDDVRQVIVSLLSNAVEAVEDKGEIYLSSEEDAGFAHVYIQDSGGGISAENQEKIFDPFFTTKGKSRTGLGLSLAQAIVQRHRGDIEFITRENHGSTFIVKLPVAQDSASTRDKRDKSPKKSIKNSQILLIGGDDKAMEVLKKILAGKGSRLKTADSIAESLKLLSRKKFDFIFVAADTPHLQSRRLLPKFKTLTKTTPVALVRPAAGQKSETGLKELPADLIIGCPLDMDKVLTTVSKAMAGRGFSS
jgi:PAS domain S-box-containing protein